MSLRYLLDVNDATLVDIVALGDVLEADGGLLGVAVPAGAVSSRMGVGCSAAGTGGADIDFDADGRFGGHIDGSLVVRSRSHSRIL